MKKEDFTMTIDEYYERCLFLIGQVSEISPDMCNAELMTKGLDSALKKNRVKSIKTGYNDMLDWVRHLDPPHRIRIEKSFLKNFNVNPWLTEA